MILLQASITDWIQSIGVLLGVPSVVWGVVSLFRKNKEQERKILSLENIAKEQNEIVKQLKAQVDQMILQSENQRYQSSLMLDSNKLIEKQIEIQISAFHHDKNIEEQKMALEKKKRLNEIKPYFISANSASSPSDFYVNLENKGGSAINLRIEEIIAKNICFNSLGNNLRIDTGSRVKIQGRVANEQTFTNENNVFFEIKLIYEDVDNNAYYQEIKRMNTGQYIVNEPISNN
jgi:TolA-binding protein